MIQRICTHPVPDCFYFCIRFGSFFLQCEKKRKGFITKGPKSKSLSTGKILIAVRLDIFGIVISFFGGDNLINLKDNWLFVPWMNLDERQKVGCCKCMSEWSYTIQL